MNTIQKLLSVLLLCALTSAVTAQGIPLHLLRVEDTTEIGQLIAPVVDVFGDTTYQSINAKFVNDSTLLLGGDTVIHTGNIQNYAVADWSQLSGIPDSLVYRSELADSTAAIRADFPTGGGGGAGSWNDLTDVPTGFADDVDNVDDADNDPNNELQDWGNLPGIPVDISDGDDVDDADNDPNNELQDLTLSGTTLGIDDGNTVDLSVIQDGVDDADNDPNNELQNWGNLPGIPVDISDGDDVDDADNDPNNEIQTASQVAVTANVSVADKLDELFLRDYWTDTPTGIVRTSPVGVGAPPVSKGEKFYIEGGYIQKTADKTYKVTGFNDNIPAATGDDVLIIPVNGGGMNATMKVRFYKSNQPGNTYSEFIISFYNFNGTSTNNREMIVTGHNPFSSVRLLNFGSNQYAIGFFGYGNASVTRITTELVYSHNFSNNYVPAPNYVLSEAEITQTGAEFLALTDMNTVNNILNVKGRLALENVPPDNSLTNFLVQDSEGIVKQRTIDLTPDADIDPTNEIQTASQVAVTANVSVADKLDELFLRDYWTDTPTGIVRTSPVGVGAPPVSKGEKFYIDGGYIQRTGEKSYSVFGMNNTIPPVTNADDVFVIPVTGGSNSYTIKVEMFFYSSSVNFNNPTVFEISFYTFNGNATNSRDLKIDGHNPFSAIKIINNGGSEYGVGFYGANNVEIKNVNTTIKYIHNNGNTYVATPNYVIRESDITVSQTPLYALTNENNLTNEFSVFGNVLAQNFLGYAGTARATNPLTGATNQTIDAVLDELNTNSSSYFDYNSTADALHNNTGSKLGINVTDPTYTLEVNNISSDSHSAKFSKQGISPAYLFHAQKTFSLRDYNSGNAGRALTFNQDGTGHVGLQANNKSLNWFGVGALQFPPVDVANISPSLYVGSIVRDENNDLLYVSTGSEFSQISLGGSSTPNLAQVTAVGNAANSKITNLTPGTASTDAATVGQTKYNITFGEQVADFTEDGGTIYTRRLFATSLPTGSSAFPAISGATSIERWQMRFEYSGGVVKSCNDCMLSNTVSQRVYSFANTNTITVQNSGGTTINNVEIWVWYRK